MRIIILTLLFLQAQIITPGNCQPQNETSVNLNLLNKICKKFVEKIVKNLTKALIEDQFLLEQNSSDFNKTKFENIIRIFLSNFFKNNQNLAKLIIKQLCDSEKIDQEMISCIIFQNGIFTKQVKRKIINTAQSD